MKKLLLFIVLMFLPIVGMSQMDEKIEVQLTEEVDYNEDFVDGLCDAIEVKDFTDLAENYFTDTVRFYFDSEDNISDLSRDESVEFLNFIFQNTVGYEYEISLLEVEEEGLIIYKLTYTIILPDEDGEPKLGLYIFGFSERNGRIDAIVAP